MIGEEELERLGYKYMPNGREVDQPNFWFAKEKVQNAYMARWSPELSAKALAVNWISVGGLDSFAKMEKALKPGSSDSRIVSAGGGMGGK